MKKYLLIGLFLLIISGMFGYNYIYNKQVKYYDNLVKKYIEIGDKKLAVETASSPMDLSKGLMYRLYMPKDNGMIFFFKKEDNLKFWMMNTFIPLDIIWVDSNFTIVDITENATPMTFYNWFYIGTKFYSPSKPARMVIEVNAGYVYENNIKVGDKIRLVI